MKHFLILLFFISFTSNALAFPVAESISLYSIFSYWFFSLFAGGSIFLNKNNKYKVYNFLSIFIQRIYINKNGISKKSHFFSFLFFIKKYHFLVVEML